MGKDNEPRDSQPVAGKRGKEMNKLILVENIEKKIYMIRGQKVILDVDLARLYRVRTWRLNEQVKRNKRRFPEDFMFPLTRQEIMRISQNAISLKFHKNINAFTEPGIAMLSSVLHSDKAIQVNIAIMRAFIHLREVIATHKELAIKFKELENVVGKHDSQILAIFEAIRKMLIFEDKGSKKRIGFLADRNNR